jgi:hypothetical protein
VESLFADEKTPESVAPVLRVPQQRGEAGTLLEEEFKGL